MKVALAPGSQSRDLDCMTALSTSGFTSLTDQSGDLTLTDDNYVVDASVTIQGSLTIPAGKTLAFASMNDIALTVQGDINSKLAQRVVRCRRPARKLSCPVPILRRRVSRSGLADLSISMENLMHRPGHSIRDAWGFGEASWREGRGFMNEICLSTRSYFRSK